MTARVPGRRSTFRPSSAEAPAAYVFAVAAAARASFPDAPLVRVIERTSDGRKVSEGFLVRRDGDEVQVVSQGEHWLVPAGATVRNIETGERIVGARTVIPQRLRDHLTDFLRDALGWDWPGEEDEPAPTFGCDTRVPSSATMLAELVDDLAPLIAEERKRVADEVCDAVLGMTVSLEDQDGQSFGAITPEDVDLYRTAWRLS